MKRMSDKTKTSLFLTLVTIPAFFMALWADSFLGMFLNGIGFVGNAYAFLKDILDG